jgi:5-formyltetrahydrofolate cyclo-ligase
MTVATTKARLRAEARARRDAIPADERAVATAAITAWVDDALLAALPHGALVCLYDAIGSEVSTRAIAARALARGLDLAYPRLLSGGLELALHRATPDQLAPGALRIPEPPDSAPQVRAAEITLAILPGLLFDRRGARLGWGRGHYDATFAAAPDRPRIGLAYESQLVDRLPTDEHDLFVHRIVTESGLCACGPEK